MFDRSNMIYLYDGSFDGLMCCIFESAYRNERPAAIQPESEEQASLFETHVVETDESHAERVKEEVRRKISKNALHFVKKAFLTCLENKELLIFDFLQDGFKRGWISMNDITGSVMLPLYNAVRALDNEAELLKGFVRFSELGGVLVSVIEPKNYVLPMLMGHFCSRFHDEALMIYDKTHRMVLLGQNGKGRIAYLDEFTPAPAEESELEMRRMWKHFYDTIAIKERYNPRCRMGHMPKRYWAHMTEFWEENCARSEEKPEKLPEKPQLALGKL
ncbi:MAG: TIGR03915 family putative DNA repair protein [Clostridiales bacterium]|nr:TIGR03915 family putative DNA repair protein [Clostridiales bacterium]